jgi:hypothetical protein
MEKSCREQAEAKASAKRTDVDHPVINTEFKTPKSCSQYETCRKCDNVEKNDSSGLCTTCYDNCDNCMRMKSSSTQLCKECLENWPIATKTLETPPNQLICFKTPEKPIKHREINERQRGRNVRRKSLMNDMN